MKKINFTKKGAFILIVVSIICLFVEPIGYYSIYFDPLNITWKRVVFKLLGVAVLLSGIPYFPHKPESLKKWLYFMIIAFSLKAIAQLAFTLYMYRFVILIPYIGATIFFLLSLIAAIIAYKNTQFPAAEGQSWYPTDHDR